jgi:transcription elongation GreA/GreB family factor
MMERSDEVKVENSQSSEDWFMEQLARPDADMDWLIQAVAAVAKGGKTERAESWADLLQDVLSRRGNGAGSVRLLSLRASWRGNDAAFRKMCEKTLQPMFQADRLSTGQFRACGFDKGVPVAECLRRLDVLMRLKTGSCCWERNWGLGVIKSVDEFTLRIAMDFAKKPGHQMSFAYAAEGLQPVGPDHLMVRHRTEPAAIQTMVERQPDEIVRLALNSFGPLTVVELQERLVPALVAESDWKRFWDGARKGLKKEGLVSIPSKRTEPMRILPRVAAFDGEWFRNLLAERDLESVLAAMQTLAERGKPSELDGEAKAVLLDRLAFLLKGATSSQPDLKARGAVLAVRLGISGSGVDVAAVAGELMSPTRLLLLLSKLRARDLAEVIAFMKEYNGAEVLDRLVGLIPLLPLTALESAVGFLTEQGEEARALGVLKSAVASHEAGPSALAWLCRHLDRATEAGIPRDDVLGLALGVLNESLSGEALKARNQIQTFFENRAWVARVCEKLTDEQRAGLLKRMNRMGNWEVSSRRSAMANMIRACPELERLLAEDGGGSAPPARTRVTSWRSYRLRQAQLKNIVEVEIPKNSHEIANARAYGDLSENFEYKAAKDNQRVLMQRQREFEADLREVQGSDLKPATHDRVGCGTRATVRWEDGAEEYFNVLGEWDREETLGIISNRSQMAEAMEGLAVGATFRAGADGGRKGTIMAVEPLPDAVRKWINGE